MKKLILLLFVTASSVCAFAQTTMDFETWSGNDPQGWVSGNAIMLLGNPQSVFKETLAANVHGGTSSMKLVTVTLTNNPDPTSIPDPMGAAFPGVVNMSPLGLKDGFPYTARPATASFWYKYTPVGGDSSSCFVMLSKWNGTSRDTIAVGGLVMMGAAAYTQGNINLIYDGAFSSVFPDSMRLYFSATCYTSLNCGTAGSTLWVDDITFTGWNGMNEPVSSEGVTLFPNPAVDHVTISVDALESAASVIAYDAAGKAVASASLTAPTNGTNNKTGKINTSALSSGLYSYSIIDTNGNSLRSGKFSVVK